MLEPNSEAAEAGVAFDLQFLISAATRFK